MSAHGDDDYFYNESTLSTHFMIEPAALELLAAQVERWSPTYPRVRVRVRRAVLCGTVPDGLFRAATGAYLLVVGDKHRGAVSRARTGDVPRVVVRRAVARRRSFRWKGAQAMRPGLLVPASARLGGEGGTVRAGSAVGRRPWR